MESDRSKTSSLSNQNGYVAALLSASIPREWAFPKEEYDRRLAAVRAAMAIRGVDVLLIHSPVDMCYLTGYQTLWPSDYACVVVPAERPMFMHVGDFEVGCAVLFGPLEDFEPLRWESVQQDVTVVAEQLGAILRSRGYGASRIGVQSGRLEMGLHGPLDGKSLGRLAGALPAATVVDATELMFEVRLRKSPLEVQAHREAASQTVRAMDASISGISEAVYDSDVAAIASAALSRAGSDFPSISPVISAGYRSGYFHTTTAGYRFRAGDHVLVELAGVRHRYSSPQMRTVLLPPVVGTSSRVSEVVAECHRVLIQGVRPGRTGHDVASDAARVLATIADLGLFHSGVFGYSIGVGFPPTWTDGPGYLMEGSELELEAGMVFHLPLSLRRPMEWAVGHSESVVVTEDGCEVLTTGAADERPSL